MDVSETRPTSTGLPDRPGLPMESGIRAQVDIREPNQQYGNGGNPLQFDDTIVCRNNFQVILVACPVSSSSPAGAVNHGKRAEGQRDGSSQRHGARLPAGCGSAAASGLVINGPAIDPIEAVPPASGSRQ